MAEVSDPQRDFYTRLMSQYRGRTLKRGDRSKSTRALQLFLREKGYDIKADGVFGKRTEAALREYQEANGLSADGQAGKQTLTKIREGITPTPRERPTKAPEAAPISEPIGLGGARPVPRARPAPSFEPEIMPPMPSATALPAPPEGPPPFQGTSMGVPPPMPLTPPPSPPPSVSPSPTLPPSLPEPSTALPAPPMPEALGPPPTDPSVWGGKFVQPQPVPPAQKTAESYTSDLDRAAEHGMSVPPTQLVEALAAGGAPAAGVPLPNSGGITPEQIAMIQALMQQGGARGLPSGQAGY